MQFALFTILSALLLAFATPALARDPFARSAQVDPSFRYYQDRSPESIASELRINGYMAIRYVVTRDTTASAQLVQACQKAGIAVCYTTFGNGVYNKGDLPPGWQHWKMRTKDPNASAEHFTYLCMNHPGYRLWRKAQMIAILKRIPFDACEIMEPFWPAYEGPKNALYACLCDHCRAGFIKAYPEATEIPNFTDSKHANYYRANRELYKKWIEFRAQSVASFLDSMINGPGGVRRNFPRLKVAVWGIADDIPNAVATLKEWEGIDGALVVKTVKPDWYVLQTDWPDWMKPNLPPEYVLKYKPFVDAIRETGSQIPIQLQTDSGSDAKCRRGSDWLQKCDDAAKQIGMIGIVPYEYHLSLDIYEAPPKPMYASGLSNIVTIIFNKRLDASTAENAQNYTAAPGNVVSAKLDGNLVKLQVAGRPATVTANNLSDDPARRFFKNYPAVTMPAPVSVTVQWR